MDSINITRHPLIDSADEIVSAFGEKTWPGISVHWSLSWVSSCPDLIEAEALLAKHDDTVLGFTIIYRVIKLEPLRYMGSPWIKINRWLRKFAQDPFTLRIAYVDLPYTDEESIFISPQVKDTDAIREKLIQAALTDDNSDAVCLRTITGSPTDILTKDLPIVLMPDGTVLKLTNTYEDWLASCSKNLRARIRRDDRRLAKAGGKIIRITDTREHAKIIVKQQHATVETSLAKGSIESPLVLSEAFFEKFSNLADTTGVVIAAVVDNTIIGSLIVILSPGKRALVGPCGLDYAVSQKNRTYFCLWPEVIALATEYGCKEVAFGSEAYDFKLRLGATRVLTQYRVAYQSKLLRTIETPLTKMLSSTMGSR